MARFSPLNTHTQGPEGLIGLINWRDIIADILCISNDYTPPPPHPLACFYSWLWLHPLILSCFSPLSYSPACFNSWLQPLLLSCLISFMVTSSPTPLLALFMVTPSPTLLLAFIHGYTLPYSPAYFYSCLHTLLFSCLLLFMFTHSPTLLLTFIHVYTLSYSPACFYSCLHTLLLSCLLLFMVKPSPPLLLTFIHGYKLSYSPACFYSWLHPLLLSCLRLFIVTPSPPLLLSFIHSYSLTYSPAFFSLWLHPLLLSAFFLLMITFYDGYTPPSSPAFYLLLFCFLSVDFTPSFSSTSISLLMNTPPSFSHAFSLMRFTHSISSHFFPLILNPLFPFYLSIDEYTPSFCQAFSLMRFLCYLSVDDID
jgi:hypothetical protein